GWGVSAIALTAWHFPQHRQAAAAEFTSRLNGKAVQREAASKGLAMIRTFAGDAAGVRELLDHPDDRICIGAIRGFHDARREMNMTRRVPGYRPPASPPQPPLPEPTPDRRDAPPHAPPPA